MTSPTRTMRPVTGWAVIDTDGHLLIHRHAQQRIRNYRPPTQTIHPWQFGHGETKATCLWLDGLLPLQPTDIVDGRQARVHRMPQSPNRWRERSRTYQGIADAMADQWGGDADERIAA